MSVCVVGDRHGMASVWRSLSNLSELVISFPHYISAQLCIPNQQRLQKGCLTDLGTQQSAALQSHARESSLMEQHALGPARPMELWQGLVFTAYPGFWELSKAREFWAWGCPLSFVSFLLSSIHAPNLFISLFLFLPISLSSFPLSPLPPSSCSSLSFQVFTM